MDAAHFVLAPFLGYLWTRLRRFIRAPSGRQRFNVLGALNAVTHQLVTVTNDSYINAQSVCDLLRKIAAAHQEIPITLILDNARYQKCKIVWALAESLKIELLYLPSYSPNLNLIERLWKFVKKQVLYSKYYADFTCFSGAITDCLAQTHTQHKAALDSLLTLRFQTLQEPQNVAAGGISSCGIRSDDLNNQESFSAVSTKAVIFPFVTPFVVTVANSDNMTSRN